MDILFKIAEFTPFLVIVILGYILISSRRQSGSESNLTPIHKEICGARIGAWNYTIPFVRLSVYDDFLVVSYSKKIVLKFNEITKIKKVFGINPFGASFRIYHSRRDIPEIINIWSTSGQKGYNKIRSKLL